MERIIYKYQLEKADIQTIPIPKNAVILTAQVQFGQICVWALIDPNAEKEDYIFEIFGTGYTIIDGNIVRRYISTVKLSNGNLVLHIFYRRN